MHYKTSIFFIAMTTYSIVSPQYGAAINNKQYRNFVISKVYSKEGLYFIIDEYSRRFQFTNNQGRPEFNWFAIPSNERIFFYDKNSPYKEFSNFYEVPTVIDGITWHTTEQYYQAQKFSDNLSLFNQIKNARSDNQGAAARKAFEIAKKHKNEVIYNWNDINIAIMYKAVYEKFKQNAHLKNILYSTGNAILIENAGKNDTFFGAGADGKGYNMLGLILMLVRYNLQLDDQNQAPYHGNNNLLSQSFGPQSTQSFVNKKSTMVEQIKSWLQNSARWVRNKIIIQ